MIEYSEAKTLTMAAVSGLSKNITARKIEGVRVANTLVFKLLSLFSSAQVPSRGFTKQSTAFLV